jgi:hypothetical protein
MLAFNARRELSISKMPACVAVVAKSRSEVAALDDEAELGELFGIVVDDEDDEDDELLCGMVLGWLE